MARTDTRFRAAYNALLEQINAMALGDLLPSEHTIAADLNVSRTVVRAVLQRMHDEKLIEWKGRAKQVLRTPKPQDRIFERDDYITLRELEGRFLDWVLRFDVPAETPLNVAQLAKEFSVPPHMLQEFLAGLSQFGLVDRRPRGGWRLLGFTADYAIELSEFRELLEVNAARTVAALPPEHPIWAKLDALEERHLDLLARVETDFHDFSKLDEAFHATLNAEVKNRFVSDFQKVFTLIFHYHYQWDKREERHRNEAAIGEHLSILAALRSHDPDAAARMTRMHLTTSKETLLSSLRVNKLV